jgi:hypothetical protein
MKGKGDTAERTLRMVSVVEKLCRGRSVIVWKMTSAEALRIMMWVVVGTALEAGGKWSEGYIGFVIP